MACEEHFLTSSSENFARRREGRSSALRVFFCISLSFSRGKGFSPLSRAWSLRLRNSSNHSKARVVWYPRLSDLWKRLVFNHHRRTRTERERGNLHPLSHQIVLLLKSEFRERDTKKSKPRVFFFGSAQFLSSRDTTLRIKLLHIFLLIIADLFVLRARALLPEREYVREKERKKERKKDQKSKKKIKMTNRFS